jgi:hypothetical protein
MAFINPTRLPRRNGALVSASVLAPVVRYVTESGPRWYCLETVRAFFMFGAMYTFREVSGKLAVKWT